MKKYIKAYGNINSYDVSEIIENFDPYFDYLDYVYTDGDYSYYEGLVKDRNSDFYAFIKDVEVTGDVGESWDQPSWVGDVLNFEWDYDYPYSGDINDNDAHAIMDDYSVWLKVWNLLKSTPLEYQK